MIGIVRSLIIRGYKSIIDDYLAPLYFRHHNVTFSSGATKFNGMPFVSKGSNSIIKIGSNASIISRERSNPLAIDHATSFITYDSASIIIGNNCSLSGVIIIAKTSIEIGDYTMIGANVRIYDTDFHPTDPDMRKKHPTRSAKSKPIRIGSNVFIGCNVHILKGVTIADKAVIPAGSFVRRDFPKL